MDRKAFLLVAACFFVFGALQTLQIGSRAADNEQRATRERCPPDGSQIALFTRQALPIAVTRGEPTGSR